MSTRIERIGLATLYLGDCRDLIPEVGPINAVITDPPYGAAYTSNYTVGQGTQPITNDGTRVSLRLYRAVAPLLAGVPVLWFTRWDAWPDVWEVLGAHMPIKGLLVWNKGHPGMGDLNHWGNSHEMIASCGPVKCRGGRDSSVLSYAPVPSNNRHHPTEKPIGLLTYLTEKITDRGQCVMDPFMGSGSQGVAATAAGRRFVGIEVDQKNFDIACRRIEDAQRQTDLFSAGDAA